MTEKFLGEYIDEFFENTKNLSMADLCATAAGFMNLVIYHNPQDFINWAEPLISRPADRARHVHHDVLSAQIREAHNRLVEIRRGS